MAVVVVVVLLLLNRWLMAWLVGSPRDKRCRMKGTLSPTFFDQIFSDDLIKIERQRLILSIQTDLRNA